MVGGEPVEEGRRQEAAMLKVSPQLGIQTPNVRGRLNRRLSRGLNPHFSQAIATLLPKPKSCL